jgi:phage I-like protein
MPIPKPGKGESQKAFISRCASALAKSDPSRDNEQRVAMCYTSWKREKSIKASEEGMPKDLRLAFFDEQKDFTVVEEEGVKYFRKPILKFGIWKHPDNREIEFEITPEVVKEIAANFDRGIPVEAPIVLTHTDNPKMKVGGVKKFIPTDIGLDALFSIADEEMVDNIKNKEKTPGVSCWLDLNYKDKQSDKDVGAVVKHVALVNHPYIEGLGGYEAVSLSEDKEAEKFVPLVMSESKSMKDGKIMKLNDVLKVLKEEHKIDVPKLQGDLKILNKQIEDGDLVKKAEVPATLSEELLTEIKEKLEIDEKVTKVDEIVKALFAKVKETLKLSESKDKKETALEKEVKALRKENDESKAKLTEMEADKAIDALVVENKVLPAEKETLKKLYTKDQALFTEFVATRSKPLIELAEIGAKGDEIPKEEKEKDEAEATRLAKLAEKKGMVKVQT